MPHSDASSTLLPEQISGLYQRAIAVAHHAYAPYSHFRVGAAILLAGGDIVTGCNVENGSYRLTVCAEQAAIAGAVAVYGPGIRVRAIAIANLNAAASPPCGACRQTLQEFGAPDTLVVFPSEGDCLAQTTLAKLLPAAFLHP